MFAKKTGSDNTFEDNYDKDIEIILSGFMPIMDYVKVNTSNLGKWNKAFYQFLIDGKVNNKSLIAADYLPFVKYRLINIDNNKTPELICYDGRTLKNNHKSLVRWYGYNA